MSATDKDVGMVFGIALTAIAVLMILSMLLSHCDSEANCGAMCNRRVAEYTEATLSKNARCVCAQVSP